ncbi:MAG: hypothetical protein CMP57_01940 [Flavobacteriales bacterium]|nr:hypothetical protein [Flavobacteriales bacterium]|tara:strand:+ start:9616 stop:9954 length:339 start_codon:yes stop_codon:yes gene_type:complete
MKEIEIVLGEDDHLEDILLHNKHRISVHLAKMLIWALDNNMDSFSFANIKIEGDDGGNFQLGCKREDYLEALEKQKENLIEFEEYELCPKMEEWIGYLEAEIIVKNIDDHLR